MSKASVNNLIEKFHIEEGTKSIDIVVSFLKYSGLKLLLPMLEEALHRNIEIRIFTSTYLSITEPLSLYKLLFIMPEGSVKLFNGASPSFHPKAYFFHNHIEDHSKVYVGSSNISKVALVDGVEWNYCIENHNDPESYNYLSNEFTYLFDQEGITLTESVVDEYAKHFVDTSHFNRKINQHFISLKDELDEVVEEKSFKPNLAQAEALLKLAKTRIDGNDKALVIAATGIGKTALAAFDSESFKSVLFVAHREEILNQAYDTFGYIRNENNFGRLYKNFDEYADIQFASVQTLSRKNHLTQFEKDQFDYIVIDEFHHASASSYIKVLDYFTPQFLLGLTATPHRLDQKNIFELCDYNVVYDFDLFTAINRGLLVPFQYYGIHDYTVDYNGITFKSGMYVPKELEQALMIDKRAELIYTYYRSHYRSNTLSFCSTINHAEAMAEYFSNKGVKVATVHSLTNSKHYRKRDEAIEALKNQELEMLFTVDMFNEGVDIPCINLILLLRPTESPTVFLQQLGRGLRLFEGKRDLKLLDFVGNFKKVDMIPNILLRDQKLNSKTFVKDITSEENLPLNCSVQFEFEVIDIIKKTLDAKIKSKFKVMDLYKRTKKKLDAIPSRMNFYNNLLTEEYEYIKKQSKHNPFKDYIKFLEINEPDHHTTLNRNERLFIKTIESTSMSKMYKLTILNAFYNQGQFKTTIDKPDMINAFRVFYSNPRNFEDIKDQKNFMHDELSSDDKLWKLIKTMPIKFLTKAHGDIFSFNNDLMTIDLELDINNTFIEQVHDVIKFRRNEYCDIRLD